MALTQPILYSQVAFDATQEHLFPFNVIGGDQVVANTLTIKNNTTNQQVYSARQVTFVLGHTLPSNTLTNGGYYSATVITENANGETSVSSNAIQFYCYSSPSFIFTNLVNGASLTNSSYNFEIKYIQTQGEPLEQYSFNLYDYGKNLILTSGILYTNSESSEFVGQYSFTGFSNNTSYYIECIGITKEGTQITTGLILFGINYNSSSTKLNLVNNCLGGYVFVSSNPVAIFGKSNPSPPIYVDEEVNLTSLDSYVLWDNGFTTSTTDWTLSIWGNNFNANTEICSFVNDSQDIISIKYMVNNNNVFVSLLVKNNQTNFEYLIYSNSVTLLSNTDNLMIWVRRINNIYDIVLNILGG